MERYLVYLKEYDDGHWRAECPALSVSCDAPDSANALYGCRRMIQETGRELLLAGNRLPKEEHIVIQGTTPIMLEFDMESEYETNASAPVRRTVSLPEWLDKRLRAANIDASRLFQDAAVERLRQMDAERLGVPKIATKADLEDACLPGVLDDYFKYRLKTIMALTEKGEE